MAEVDLATAFNLTSSLLEQLGKALVELEAHKDGAADMISFMEISEYFHDFEARMKKKYSELEAKEEAFKQEESDGRLLLAAREVAVAAKEQDMFDRIQLLKDAAVAAIAESRANHLPPDEITDGTENKCETNASFPGSKGESSGKTGGTDAGGGEVSVSVYRELAHFCEQMDPRGLLTCISENRKTCFVLCEELSFALKRCTEPCRLVLDSLDGFYSTEEDDKKDGDALQAVRQSCITLMDAMNAMLARAGSGVDHLLNQEIKQRARVIAHEWKPKLAHDSIIDAPDGKSIEADAFLRLLATFRIGSEFDEDELCKFAFAVCERKQAPKAYRNLGLAHKMPGVIEELISRGQLIGAVHFVHTFDLVHKYPTIPLLKTYLRDLRRSTQGKRGNSGNPESDQHDGNQQELLALRAVINCVQKYDLESDYPLDTLQKRVAQLERYYRDRRRGHDKYVIPLPFKKYRKNKEDAVYGPHSPSAPAPNPNPTPTPTPNPTPTPVYMDRGPYVAPPSERYPHPGVTDPYHYQPPPPTQTAYGQQVYEQGAYYYPPDNRSAAATAAPQPPAYGGYAGSGVPTSYQPYL